MQRKHVLVDLDVLRTVPTIVGMFVDGKKQTRKPTEAEERRMDEKMNGLQTKNEIDPELFRPLDRAQIDGIRKYTADKGTALLERITKKVGKSAGVSIPPFMMNLTETDYAGAIAINNRLYDFERVAQRETFLRFVLRSGGELAMNSDIDEELRAGVPGVIDRINAVKEKPWLGIFASYPIKRKPTTIIYVPDFMPAEKVEDEEEDKGPYVYTTFNTLETVHSVVRVVEPMVPVALIKSFIRKALAGRIESEDEAVD